jgi:hypothetical protein
MSIFGNADLGPSGGDYDGFVSWTSQGSDDGRIPRRSFSVNIDKQRHPWAAPSQGVALDIRRLKVGWEKNDKDMPRPHRVLVPIGTPFPASPGEGYRKALSVPVSAGDDKVFLWEQGGPSAFETLVHLAPLLAAQESANAGKVPVVRMAGTIEMQINGKSLGAAKLEPVQWVDPAAVFPTPTPAPSGPATAGNFGAPQQPQGAPGFGGQQAPAQPVQQPGAFPGGPVASNQPEF